MPEPTSDASPFTGALDQLIAYFNRRVMDVPDGFFDRNARFSLNGVPFEALLGRSDADPLVRMIARGAAGYRFGARPLLHALETALVARVSTTAGPGRWTVVLSLRGTLRGSGRVLDDTVEAVFETTDDGVVTAAHVSVPRAALDAIRAARQS
jgi:hypothetical protein